MQPEIWECDAYLIETNNGTEIVPVDVCGDWPEEIADVRIDPNAESARMKSASEFFRDYLESDTIHDISRKHGFCYRLSMPGYLDCIDTGFADSELEALEELLSLYGNETGEPEEWEASVESRIAELKQESK